jgi:hypothetical protein
VPFAAQSMRLRAAARAAYAGRCRRRRQDAALTWSRRVRIWSWLRFTPSYFHLAAETRDQSLQLRRTARAIFGAAPEDRLQIR